MTRRSQGIGVLVAGIVISVYFIGAIGAALAARELGRRQVQDFTSAFLAQATKDSAARAASEKAANAAQKSQADAMPMTLVIPLFVANARFSSTLVLVNALSAAAYADVVVRGADGAQLVTQRVNFGPHDQQQLDIGQLLASTHSSETRGSIMVMPSPMLTSETIGAQLSMTYFGSSQPNYIDEEPSMPGTTGSQELRGVADSGEGSPVLAIASVIETAQRVTIRCLEGQIAFSKHIEIRGGATLVGPACSEGESDALELDPAEVSPASRSGVGVSITSDAMPGSFAAFALVPHRTTKDEKFFSSVPFVDPKMLMSPDTVFAGVPVGAADVLPGSKYVPEVSIANFSARAAHVTIQYAQTSASTPVVQNAEKLVLPPSATKSITLSGLQGDPTIQNSFIVTSDGSPGDVLAKLVSKSDDGIREVELMGKDEMDTDNGGNHPWSIEGGSDSTLLLFNPTSSPQYFNVLLSGGGATWQKALQLQPMQTKAVDIRKIVLDQLEDDKGKTLPVSAQTGQVDWYVPARNAGRGRVLESNRASLIARNFSCGGTIMLCQITLGSQGFLEYLSTVPGWGSVTPYVCMNQCSGTVLGQGGSGLTYSWSVNGAPTISGSSTSSSLGLYGNSVGTGTASVEVSDPYCQLNGQLPAPVVHVTITTVNLTSDQVTVNLSGPSGTTGNLDVVWSGPSGNAAIVNTNEGVGTYTFNPPLANLVTGQYTGVIASWGAAANVYSYTFNVLGSYQHTQYNTPAESQCSGGSATAYLTPGPSACAWSTVSLVQQFISQAWINGSGVTNNYGPCQEYLNGCSAPQGGNQNYFREVSSISPGCGSPNNFLSNSSVAVDVFSSNHPLQCGDQVLIVGLGSGAGTVKTATDSCPACNGAAHIDDYNASNACSLSSLGNFQTIRLGR